MILWRDRDRNSEGIDFYLLCPKESFQYRVIEAFYPIESITRTVDDTKDVRNQVGHWIHACGLGLADEAINLQSCDCFSKFVGNMSNQRQPRFIGPERDLQPCFIQSQSTAQDSGQIIWPCD